MCAPYARLQHAAGRVLFEDIRSYALERIHPDVSAEARATAVKAIDALKVRAPAGDWLLCAGVGVLDDSGRTDPGDEPYVEATVLGIPYPLYGEPFPAHVAAYEKQFGGG